MKQNWFWFGCVLATPWYGWGFQMSDPVGDTAGPDVVQFEYQVHNQAVKLKLTFAQELEGAVIDPAVLVSLLFDTDRSLLTGFRPGPGFHTGFGVDYEVEILLGGFGPSSNYGVLKYWRRKVSSTPPWVELERVQIPLGDWLEQNGSVLVVGADATYGTDNHQILLHVPLNLFSNVSFPICGEGNACINQLFPCPLPVTNHVPTAFVSLLAMDPYSFEGTADVLPGQGMIDSGSGAIASGFPTGDDDLVVSITDPADDGIAQPGINGEEIIGIRVFRHFNNALSFELKLQSYTFDDTAIYCVALDVDNNPATGEPWQNGTTMLGMDLFAEFANFDNPIGWANPLEGTVHFRKDGQWCPLLYADYLATVWRSTPGYVFVTLPAEHTAAGRALNASGTVKAIALTREPGITFFNDSAPNSGAAEIPIEPALSLRICSLVQRPDRTLALRFTWNGTASNCAVLSAPDLTASWSEEESAEFSVLGGGLVEATFSPPPSIPDRRFYRVVVTPKP